MKEQAIRLIHYGANKFDPEKFMPISDIPYRNKPSGGLWTSPIDAEYGWREWTAAEDYYQSDEFFELDFKGSVLEIDDAKDMEKLPWIEQETMHFISFQTMCSIDFHYDAIHLTTREPK